MQSKRPLFSPQISSLHGTVPMSPPSLEVGSLLTPHTPLAPARWEAQSSSPAGGPSRRPSSVILPPDWYSPHISPTIDWHSAPSPSATASWAAQSPRPPPSPRGVPRTCQVSGAVGVTLAVGVALLDGGGSVAERGGEDCCAVLHQRRADGRVVARRRAVQRCPRRGGVREWPRIRPRVPRPAAPSRPTPAPRGSESELTSRGCQGS